MTTTDKTALLLRLLRERILILDGAMGTMIQAEKLGEADFRGAPACGLCDHTHDLKGDNDLLALTQPGVVAAIHDAFLEAGADIIETNTFNATRIAQSDYRLEAKVRDINFAAARIARERADAWTAKTPDKPRFDFYKILPGAEEPRIAPERKAADKAIERLGDKAAAEAATKAVPAGAVKPADRMWLQAGAFASESDAESLKARLALAGWEAAVQSATVPDQGVRYRVRMGPFDNTDEVNHVKSELGKSGFEVAVIKNP